MATTVRLTFIAGGLIHRAETSTLLKQSATLDRMARRQRVRICVWLIVLGLGNFFLYAISYAIIGGDAHNGAIRDGEYFVRGHFVHTATGMERPVRAWVWYYSYLHSISIWPSIAAVLLSMLALARPHIMATYKHGIVRGGTLVTVISTLIVFVTMLIMVTFIVHFVNTVYP